MTAWYADRGSRKLILRRYVPWLAALSLAWEFAQLPLYTIWTQASPAYIAFAVAHCTAGDVLIGSACLGLALMAGREGAVLEWRWWRVIGITVLLATAYTLFSESMNTTLLRWSYSDSMPVWSAGPVHVGLAPLAQWLVVPLVALILARPRRRHARTPIT